MADKKIEKDQTKVERNEPTKEQEIAEVTVSLAASSLAGMFLQHQVRKGLEIEIPSLGITVNKGDT